MRALSTAPRRAAAGVAFEARAVAHQGEIAAFAAGFAFVALGLGLGALLGRALARRALGPSRVGELQLLELLGGRELLLGLGLERGRCPRFRRASRGPRMPSRCAGAAAREHRRAADRGGARASAPHPPREPKACRCASA